MTASPGFPGIITHENAPAVHAGVKIQPNCGVCRDPDIANQYLANMNSFFPVMCIAFSLKAGVNGFTGNAREMDHAQTYSFSGADLQLSFPSGNPGLVYAYPLGTAKFAVWF